MLVKSDRYTIQKDLQIFDGRNFQLASGTGTKIGTGATQKLGFFGKTPAIQPTDIGVPAFSTVGDAEIWAANLRTNIIRALGLSS